MILHIDNFKNYDKIMSRANMFVIGAGSGEVSVTKRRIEKFGLNLLPIGFISLDNKHSITYKK